MKRTVVALLALAVIVLTGFTMRDSGTAATQSGFSADDKAAVQGIVNTFANSWNSHDMKAMHEIDTDDVEWINGVGNDWKGKDMVLKGHSAIHKGMFAKQTMSVESMAVRPLAPNVAVAVAVMHFSSANDPRYPWLVAVKTRGSFTVVKRDGVWKIAHYQNTVIDPKAENDHVTDYDATGFPPPSAR